MPDVVYLNRADTLEKTFQLWEKHIHEFIAKKDIGDELLISLGYLTLGISVEEKEGEPGILELLYFVPAVMSFYNSLLKHPEIQKVKDKEDIIKDVIKFSNIINKLTEGSTIEYIESTCNDNQEIQSFEFYYSLDDQYNVVFSLHVS